METLYKSTPAQPPQVSLVLLDWSCRESFHSLSYLARQDVARDKYEIIWVEYYDRRSPQIRTLLDDAKSRGIPAPVDQWIVMDVPRETYYHKHLMYNVGIVAARGRILTLCDSDAMFRQTFIRTILKQFDSDPNVVFHMDQVRNNDRKFYPFNFPTIEEVTGPGAINFTNESTTGLQDSTDTLHTRNYGACFSALRSDLIAIGGADEHTDFVGHICGPYDLTFRLGNLGRRELWDPQELLYHTWHPGQAGERNFLGPHDGRHMSTTSLAARATGRVQPLQENPGIRVLRLGEDVDLGVPLLSLSLPVNEFADWTIEALEANSRLQRRNPGSNRARVLGLARHPRVAVTLAWVFIKLIGKFVAMKIGRFSRRSARPREFLEKPLRAFGYFKRTSRSVAHSIGHVLLCLERLWSEGVREVSIYGLGPVLDIVQSLHWRYPFEVQVLSDYSPADGGE